MDITKAPPMIDPANLGVGTGSAAGGVSTASDASTTVTAAADRVDIQPLDVTAALQILIAEVRAELADVAAGPLSPTQPPGLALLESQAMPFNSSAASELFPRLSNSEQSVPLAPLVPMTEAPVQGPLPEAPALAASAAGAPSSPTLRPDGSAVSPQTSPGIGSPGTGTGTGSGANSGVDLAPLPAGQLPRVPLPSIPLSAIPPDLNLGPLEPLFMPPGVRLSSPAQAAPMLMRLFLQAVPEDADSPVRWSATVTQLEVTLQSALDRAVATVEQWRNVPQVVVDAARETRGAVMSQLNDEPPLPLWLRPEWMWLSPRMERFRRRRRLARRGLTDPDMWSLPEDDIRQEAPGTRRDEPKL